MRKCLFIMAVALAMMCAGCKTHKAAVLPKKAETSLSDVSPTTLIIWYDAGVGPTGLLKAVKDQKCEVIYQYNTFSAIAIKVPDGSKIKDYMEYFRKVEGVLQVNRDHIYHLD